MKFFLCSIWTFSVLLNIVQSQVPPRLNIPGAVLVTQARPAPFRPPRIHADSGLPPRIRGRPNTANPPSPPIRPVVEEAEDTPPSTPNSNNFDDEVSKLGISALQSAVRQAVSAEEEEEEAPQPQQPQRQVHFRPERPLPVLRQDIRESLPPQPRPVPVQRQEQRENYPRPLFRQDLREDLPIPVRQQQPVRHSQPRQQAPPQQQQIVRQPTRGPVRQLSQHLDDDGTRPNHARPRKPIVQILKKFRNDNADGSISWGFENDDGTFKEETLGTDCVIKGKYGYVDPDGVRREYSYEAGNKCDPQAEEEEEEDSPIPNRPPPALQPRKPQYRPLPQQI